MAYTNSSLISYTRISPNKTPNRNHKIDTITIHCVVGQLTVESLGNVFSNTSRSSSCNYGIGKDGRIGMYVEEKDRSWCSSNAANDHRAITIEVASDTTHPYAVNDVVLASLINLCTDICKRNNIKKLVWSTNKNDRVNHLNGCNMTVHRDFANKSCPGDYLYNKHGYIADEVNKKLGVSSITTTTSTTSNKTSKEVPVKITQSKTNVKKYLNEYYCTEIKYVLGKLLVVDGVLGANSKRGIAIAMQVELNKLGAKLTVDGKFGGKSATAFTKYVGTLKKGSKGIFVTLWQCLLLANNLDPRGLDGIMGEGCVKATNDLFVKANLSKDSIVSGEDINTLL